MIRAYNIKNGENLRDWRKHRCMTQEQLAQRIGMTGSQISRVEKGVYGISKALKSKLEELEPELSPLETLMDNLEACKEEYPVYFKRNGIFDKLLIATDKKTLEKDPSLAEEYLNLLNISLNTFLILRDEKLIYAYINYEALGKPAYKNKITTQYQNVSKLIRQLFKSLFERMSKSKIRHFKEEMK
ncbi:MAG: helix-turn-helix transcriptional regulator [Lachnospiraceae bacterium]|nr:helix-turn-helix transcriptional regulator [Lachnospiraceae bacterium]